MTSGLTIIGSTLAALAGIGIAFRKQRFHVSRLAALYFTAGLLAVDFAGTASLLGWRYHQANRDVDVTNQVSVGTNTALLPDQRALFSFDITADRSRIEIVFLVRDTNSKIGTCVPSTSLFVTPSVGGNRGASVTGFPGRPLSLQMAKNAHSLSLDVLIKNTRGDNNCAVDVDVTSAILTND